MKIVLGSVWFAFVFAGGGMFAVQCECGHVGTACIVMLWVCGVFAGFVYWLELEQASPAVSRWRDFHTNPPTANAALIVHAESADPKMPLIVTAWFSPDFGLSLVPEMWIPSITHWMPIPDPPEEACRETAD